MRSSLSITYLGLWFLLAWTTNYEITAQVSSELLLSGQWAKVEIDRSGIYEITSSWLEQQIDLDRNYRIDEIQVYELTSGPLNPASTFEQTERLQPISISIIDGGDGTFDDNDAIRFYSEGPNLITYDAEAGEEVFIKNVFDEQHYVFIRLGSTDELNRTEATESPIDVSTLIDEYVFSSFEHEDRVNLLDNFISTQGSGQNWYGQEISNTGTFGINSKGLVPASGLLDGKVSVRLAGRSNSREDIFLGIDGTTEHRTFSPVNTSDIEALYARILDVEVNFSRLDLTSDISIAFDKESSDARLWIDEIVIHGRTPIIYEGNQLSFNNYAALDLEDAHVGLDISTDSPLTVWDVTDRLQIKSHLITSDGEQSHITSPTDEQKKYVAFANDDAYTPLGAQAINYTDLREEGKVDYLIITSDILSEAAERLALHRQSFDGLSTYIVTPQEIYDHYSGSRQDPTAMRNYIRELYRTHANFRYVLLLGDASFDYRHLAQVYPDENVVPTYETANSLDPLLSFPSDDYFALLDNDEDHNLRGDLDIAIGRITARNSIEANNIIDKIINYDLSPSSLSDGDWKTKVVFLADDEDNNIHINDADLIAEEMKLSFPVANQEKIYFDAFIQESTPGGNRYPSASSRLNTVVDQGALVINYLGHGGPNGWGQERVLKLDDINSWSNFERLPLVITATCSFTGFDDPSRTTAGEATLLNPVGGAVALFTTVRSVYASQNFRLTREVFRTLWEKEGGAFLPIGEIMRRAKNNISNDNINSRKFFMIGDPAQRLTIPNLDIRTDAINGVDPSDGESVVRVSALDQIQLEASVIDETGNLMTDYNGTVEITVFDKPQSLQTLANDPRSFTKSYRTQQNIIYQGRASVSNGKITSTWTTPVDIDYEIGPAKISYYASSTSLPDAIGFDNSLFVGGEAVAPITDDLPPVIDVFMNNRSWTSSEVVPTINTVIVDLSDDYGLNLSTVAIGHEISAVLDGDTRSIRILSSLFEGDLADPLSGTIMFDLEELEPGEHTLEIIAFDVANNVSREEITFTVVEDFERSINSIDVRPTIIENRAEILVSTDLPDETVTMKMEVFDSSGRRVSSYSTTERSINGLISSEIVLSDHISGIYVLYFTINSPSQGDQVISKAKKVVLLK